MQLNFFFYVLMEAIKPQIFIISYFRLLNRRGVPTFSKSNLYTFAEPNVTQNHNYVVLRPYFVQSVTTVTVEKVHNLGNLFLNQEINMK